MHALLVPAPTASAAACPARCMPPSSPAPSVACRLACRGGWARLQYSACPSDAPSRQLCRQVGGIYRTGEALQFDGDVQTYRVSLPPREAWASRLGASYVLTMFCPGLPSTGRSLSQASPALRAGGQLGGPHRAPDGVLHPYTCHTCHTCPRRPCRSHAPPWRQADLGTPPPPPQCCRLTWAAGRACGSAWMRWARSQREWYPPSLAIPPSLAVIPGPWLAGRCLLGRAPAGVAQREQRWQRELRMVPAGQACPGQPACTCSSPAWEGHGMGRPTPVRDDHGS